MNTLSRRGFLAASSAAVAVAHMPRLALAQTAAPIHLTAATRTLDIDGRAASVFRFRAMGRIVRSTVLLSISTRPSVRKRPRPSRYLAM